MQATASFYSAIPSLCISDVSPVKLPDAPSNAPPILRTIVGVDALNQQKAFYHSEVVGENQLMPEHQHLQLNRVDNNQQNNVVQHAGSGRKRRGISQQITQPQVTNTAIVPAVQSNVQQSFVQRTSESVVSVSHQDSANQYNEPSHVFFNYDYDATDYGVYPDSDDDVYMQAMQGVHEEVGVPTEFNMDTRNIPRRGVSGSSGATSANSDAGKSVTQGGRVRRGISSSSVPSQQSTDHRVPLGVPIHNVSIEHTQPQVVTATYGRRRRGISNNSNVSISQLQMSTAMMSIGDNIEPSDSASNVGVNVASSVVSTTSQSSSVVRRRKRTIATR
jgi:hypothetical protein